MQKLGHCVIGDALNGLFERSIFARSTDCCAVDGSVDGAARRGRSRYSLDRAQHKYCLMLMNVEICMVRSYLVHIGTMFRAV